MFRILDLQEAVRPRGWPDHVDIAIPVAIESENGETWDQYLLEVKGGAAQIAKAHTAGEVRLTRRQLTVWYAGGYRTATAARLAGVDARSEAALKRLMCTTEYEPWLPDHF
ncbi:sterol carrier protein domain-containing protein [Streptomyces nigra]|uniref:sterol carrier protein domain-containing protein n=1 Tax=Streptomyces nigra TaxID=1827580 RepID=UPI00381AC55B